MRKAPPACAVTSRMSPVEVANDAPVLVTSRLPSISRRRYAAGSSSIALATPSAGEVGLGQARHVDGHCEDAARLRQPRELVRIAVAARGRDVKRAKVG